MTLYTLRWENDTTNQTQVVGSYTTLPDAIEAIEHHWCSITADPNYTCGDYQNSYLCLYAVGVEQLVYSVQCKRHEYNACSVRIGFVSYTANAQHPLLQVLDAKLLEADAPFDNVWGTNTPAVLYILAKRYKQQCSVVYVYPDGTEYPIRVDSDGDFIDEIPDRWCDATYQALFGA
jgi:hypothetical protein